MPRQTYKQADALQPGDRINFFRGETDTIQPGERNDALTDTVRSVQPLEGGMVRIETVSNHVLKRAAVCQFRLAAEEPALVGKPILSNPRSLTVRGISIE